MAYREEGIELRSAPSDDVIRAGLDRVYVGFEVKVFALFLVVVPVATFFYGLELGRAVLAVFLIGAGAWSVRRARRDLVRSALAERTGREVHVIVRGETLIAAERRAPRASVSVLVTDAAVVLTGKGLPPLVLARADVPDEALERLRAR